MNSNKSGKYRRDIDIVATFFFITDTATNISLVGSLIVRSLLFFGKNISSTINIGSFAQVGAYERKSLKDDSVYVQIVEEISHPEYNPDTHEYDFRLLRLGGWVRKHRKILVYLRRISFDLSVSEIKTFAFHFATLIRNFLFVFQGRQTGSHIEQ